MNEKPLQNLKIIDLSHRLPGPLCGKILSDLGAEVIKIEDQNFKDPFLAGLFNHVDPSFSNWYQALNEKKKIKRFDFHSEVDRENMMNELKSADGIIMGLAAKWKPYFDLSSVKKPQVIIELKSSRDIEAKSMHDINALAETGLLSLHTMQNLEDNKMAPPFLPVAGINFGLHSATQFLAYYILMQKTEKTQSFASYLDESTEKVLSIFWPKEERAKGRSTYLHNGLFPCYYLYKTKDRRWVALAAVEEKYWLNFLGTFHLKCPFDRFHNSDQGLFDWLANFFQNITSDELMEKIGKKDLCLSIF